MSKHKTNYLDVLNALSNMQHSMVYATRKPALAAAVSAIVKLESELAAAQQQVTLLSGVFSREEELQVKLAAANEKMLAQQARIEELLVCAEHYYALRHNREKDELAVTVIGRTDDLSALQAHNAKYEARVAQLVEALEYSSQVITFEGCPYYLVPTDMKDDALSAKPSDWLATHDLEVKRKVLEEAADKFSNLPKIDEFKSYVYLKGYPKDIVEIELRRMAADLQDRHSKRVAICTFCRSRASESS